MMSRKDYEKAARIVSETAFDPGERLLAIDCFALFFSDDNPRFDVDRFRKACQPKEK